MRRAVIGEFLTFIRKDRRGQSLSNGALKLHHQTLKTLFNYDRSSTLWLTRSGDPLTKAGLRQMMLTISRIKKSVADGVYTHQFRHTVVPRLLKAGVPLRSVQIYAGHSDLHTTLRYAQAIDVDEAIAGVNNMVIPNL